MAFAQQRFGVEGLKLRRAASLEEVDHPLGLGWNVRALRQWRRVGVSHDATHGKGTEAEGRRAEEVAPRGLHEAVVTREGVAHGISGKSRQHRSPRWWNRRA